MTLTGSERRKADVGAMECAERARADKLLRSTRRRLHRSTAKPARNASLRCAAAPCLERRAVRRSTSEDGQREQELPSSQQATARQLARRVPRYRQARAYSVTDRREQARTGLEGCDGDRDELARGKRKLGEQQVAGTLCGRSRGAQRIARSALLRLSESELASAVRGERSKDERKRRRDEARSARHLDAAARQKRSTRPGTLPACTPAPPATQPASPPSPSPSPPSHLPSPLPSFPASPTAQTATMDASLYDEFGNYIGPEDGLSDQSDDDQDQHNLEPSPPPAPLRAYDDDDDEHAAALDGMQVDGASHFILWSTASEARSAGPGLAATAGGVDELFASSCGVGKHGSSSSEGTCAARAGRPGGCGGESMSRSRLRLEADPARAAWRVSTAASPCASTLSPAYPVVLGASADSPLSLFTSSSRRCAELERDRAPRRQDVLSERIGRVRRRRRDDGPGGGRAAAVDAHHRACPHAQVPPRRRNGARAAMGRPVRLSSTSPR